MKILKSRILLVIVTIILTGSISVYAAHKYAASNITYKDTTLDQALNTLYTTQNTTVNNLNSQITTKDQTISSLQSQVETLTAAASEKDYVTGTFKINAGTTNSPDLGFYPSKVLIYRLSSNWSSMKIITRSDTKAVSSWGDTNTDVSYYWEMTSNGFKSKNFPSNDTETNTTYTYYAFR